MANPSKAVAVTAAAAGGSLVIVAVLLNSLVATGMVIRDIETSEHADEVSVVSQPPESTPFHVLNLNGYWKKPVVTISFIPQGVPELELEQMIGVLEGTMQIRRDESPTNSTVTFIGWPDLLATLSSRSNMPSLETVERGSGTADIRVYLMEESHPDNKLGLARIARDKATYEIVYSEVYIYSVRELHQDGILGQVFKHELGHALGIGHATSQTSIMHSPIIIVNDTAIGKIGDCEAEGATHLYSRSQIGEINCGHYDYGQSLG